MQLATLLLEENGARALSKDLIALILLALLCLAIGLWIRKFLVRCLRALPEEHWHVQPWTSWFLLVPGINLFWNFYFLIGLSQAYSNAYESLGRALPVRETGRTEAAIFGAVCTVGLYPMNQGLLALLWMGGLLSLTIYLFKVHSMDQRFARIQLDS